MGTPSLNSRSSSKNDGAASIQLLGIRRLPCHVRSELPDGIRFGQVDSRTLERFLHWLATERCRELIVLLTVVYEHAPNGAEFLGAVSRSCPSMAVDTDRGAERRRRSGATAAGTPPFAVQAVARLVREASGRLD